MVVDRRLHIWSHRRLTNRMEQPVGIFWTKTAAPEAFQAPAALRVAYRTRWTRRARHIARLPLRRDELAGRGLAPPHDLLRTLDVCLGHDLLWGSNGDKCQLG